MDWGLSDRMFRCFECCVKARWCTNCARYLQCCMQYSPIYSSSAVVGIILSFRLFIYEHTVSFGSEQLQQALSTASTRVQQIGSETKSPMSVLLNFFKRFRRKKPPPPPRRDVFKTYEQVLASEEARDNCTKAVALYPPGTTLRWDKIITSLNIQVEPTEQNTDPIRIELDKDELRKVLHYLYDNKRSIASDGLALAREFLPLMYDKHTVERALNVSLREREQKNITDECYAYGELDHEIFAAIYLRVITIFGEKTKGIFYDLGCGVGTLVYTAAFIGDFDRVIGVENIGALLERGEKRTARFERFQSNYSEKIRNIVFDWVEDDFVQNGFWSDGTFILLHWTAFSAEQQRAIAKILSTCQEGTFVISFTNPVPGTDFEILVHDSCVTSWGKADFFFQEKVTPAKKRMV